MAGVSALHQRRSSDVVVAALRPEFAAGRLAFVWLLGILSLAPIRLVSVPASLVLLTWLPGWLILRRLPARLPRARLARGALACALSLALGPVFLNPLWHGTNDGRVLWCAWLALLSALALPRASAVDSGPAPPLFRQRATRRFGLLVICVVVLATLLPYWPAELNGVPVAATIHDYAKHHAVLSSLDHGPLPLGNPFYADERLGPTYYYHFFYLIPATLRAWTGASHALSFGAAASLTGLAVAALVYLCTRKLKGGDPPAALAAGLVTLFGALDILPLALHELLGWGAGPDPVDGPFRIVIVDGWADHAYRIHNMLNQMGWSPQNVLGIVITLVAAVLLNHGGCARWWLLLGPLLGAALIGSSVWVAMGVLPAVGLWGLIEIWRRRHRPRLMLQFAGGLLLVGVLTAALAAPSLLGYAEMAARHHKGLTTNWPANPWSVCSGWLEPGVGANLMDLPARLALELGGAFLFACLAGATVWRRAWNASGMRLLLLSAGVALCGLVAARSHFFYNDFGQKIIMLAMACGAIMGGCILDVRPGEPRWYNPLGWRLDRRWRRGRTVLAAGVWIVLVAGLPLSTVEAPFNALYRFRQVGRVAPDEQNAWQYMRAQLPTDAVVQADCGRNRLRLAQQINRQIGVMADQDDVLVFAPTNSDAYHALYREVAFALAHEPDSRRTALLLRQHGISHVYVGPLERRRWQHLERFDDARFFRPCFVRATALVVEVLPHE